jgi:hypothetical protein
LRSPTSDSAERGSESRRIVAAGEESGLIGFASWSKTAVPHFLQNLAPTVRVAPQDEHTASNLAPHCSQKTASSAPTSPHLAQRTFRLASRPSRLAEVNRFLYEAVRAYTLGALRQTMLLTGFIQSFGGNEEGYLQEACAGVRDRFSVDQ